MKKIKQAQGVAWRTLDVVTVGSESSKNQPSNSLLPILGDNYPQVYELDDAKCCFLAQLPPARTTGAVLSIIRTFYCRNHLGTNSPSCVSPERDEESCVLSLCSSGKTRSRESPAGQALVQGALCKVGLWP